MTELGIANIPQPPIDVAALMGSTNARTLKNIRSPDQAEKAAKDFESVLLAKVLEEMDKTIPRSGLLEGSTTKQVRSLYWSLLARDMARQGGLGLWKQMHKGMLKQYEAQGVKPETGSTPEK